MSSRSSSRFLAFVVKVRVRAGIGGTQTRRYVKDAVQSWGGGGQPEDAFFGLKDRDVVVKPLDVRRLRRMPKIPVNIANQPLEQEPLDEGIPYRGVVRKMDVSDKADKRGNFYLTGGQVEIISPEEWKGRSAFINYLALPVQIEAGMDIAERRKAEEVGIEFARFVKAFKIPHDDSGIDTDEMIGCEGEFMVRNEEYQGRKTAKVATFLI